MPLIRLFDGIPELLERLKEAGYSLGIVTFKDRNEYATDFLPLTLGIRITTVFAQSRMMLIPVMPCGKIRERMSFPPDILFPNRWK